MVSRLSTVARRHRRAVLLLWLLCVGACAAAATDLPDRIVPGGDLPASADAARVEREARVASLYLTIEGRALSPAAARQVVARVVAVDGVRSAALLPAPRRGAPRIVVVRTPPGLESAIDVSRRLDERRDALAPPGTRLSVGGFPAYRDQLARLSLEDLSRAERIGLPLILFVLILTFGSLWAASLPLGIAVSSVLIALGVADLVARVTDVADFVTNTTTMLGIALGVDYALFVLHRVRREARADGDIHAAVGRAMSTTGVAVAWSAVVVVLAESTLFLVDSRAVRSIALGLVLVTIVAAIATIVVLPVVLDLLGDRVLRSVWDRRRWRGDAWSRWAAIVTRHPARVAALTTLLLLAISVPAATLGRHVHAPDTSQLPRGLGAREAASAAANAQGPGAVSPVLLLAEPAEPSTARLAASTLRSDPRVASVRTIPQPHGRALILVETRSGAQAPSSHALVRDLRDGNLGRRLDPLRYRVGGETATALDIRAASFAGLWVVLALLVPLLLGLFAVALRSLVLSLKAALLAGLSLTAAFGTLVALTDTSAGAALVGFDGPVGIHPIVPVVVTAIALALTTDYEIVLIGRMRELLLIHGDGSRAIREGLAETGPVITAAAAVMLVVFGTFASADVFPIKQMGLGLAAIVLVDATIVRAALVPAAMQIAGRWNWWTPSGATSRIIAQRRAGESA